MAAVQSLVPDPQVSMAGMFAGFPAGEGLPLRPPTDHIHLKAILHRKLAERINPSAISPLAGEQEKREVLRVIHGLILTECGWMRPAEMEQIAQELMTETLGLGPLEPLLQDPSISDILVTTPKMVHVERAGKLYESPVEFKDEAHLIQVIERIVSRVGRRIDASSPLVDARLPDGSRVNAVIPPVAVDGPLLSIRRFGNDRLPAEALVQNLTLTQGMLDFLQACVKGRLNIIISGGTGAGKTTLLNVLSAFIDGSERIVTIEDAAELQLRQRHVARMESRPANSDGEGAIRIRQLVVNALRMRPDRIIVGEVRGEEALDMLQAMNTGHDGSLTTVHSNSPRDAAARLEVMVGMANANLPLRAVRQQMSSAIDLFVQISRMSDGTRRLTHVTECCGMEGDLVTTQDVFVFERTGLGENGRVKGRFKPTGIRPKFSDRLKALGIELPPSLFQTVVEIR
jgi:pilus assembly protein CpaF